MRRFLARLLLALAALLLVLLLVEIGVRATRADGRTMVRWLYYQGVRLSLHERVDDPDLLYRLRPGAEDGASSRDGQPCTLQINSAGARGPEPAEPKAPGSTRVLFFGASTVFGVGVCDEDTMPAALGRALDSLRPGPHEVYNFGTSAYTGSQVVHRARLELARVPEPDLLVLMPTNVGRRPFLEGGDEEKLDDYAMFRADPSLWLENFYLEQPWPGLDLHWTNRLHWGWLRSSALYRWVMTRGVPPERGNMGWNPYVATRAAQEADLLEAEAEAAGVPLVYVLYPQSHVRGDPNARQRLYPFGAPWISLDRPDLSPEASDLHPSAAHLVDHAAHLAELLVEGGYLAGR
jgi:hypothetical protein